MQPTPFEHSPAADPSQDRMHKSASLLIPLDDLDTRLRGVFVEAAGVQPDDQETIDDVKSYVKSLLANNQIDFQNSNRGTHAIVDQDGNRLLRRLRFN